MIKDAQNIDLKNVVYVRYIFISRHCQHLRSVNTGILEKGSKIENFRLTKCFLGQKKIIVCLSSDGIFQKVYNVCMFFISINNDNDNDEQEKQDGAKLCQAQVSPTFKV
jgi:dUTPase